MQAIDKPGFSTQAAAFRDLLQSSRRLIAETQILMEKLHRLETAAALLLPVRAPSLHGV